MYYNDSFIYKLLSFLKKKIKVNELKKIDGFDIPDYSLNFPNEIDLNEFLKQYYNFLLNNIKIYVTNTSFTNKSYDLFGNILNKFNNDFEKIIKLCKKSETLKELFDSMKIYGLNDKKIIFLLKKLVNEKLISFHSKKEGA